ncbi:MAG: alcohol dehydrogenase catalytic domain-containing protein [Myxococcaceae bacterium]|nr:alcohol dehydrogenase catalytic domain-containing protein [Myxococcaceae bacterium]
MRELTFIEPHRVEFRERPAPRIEAAGEALVRPLAVSRCDLDFAIAAGKAPFEGPFGLGHECVGEVVEVGSGVTRVKPGDRVVVPFQISCGACERCLKGQTGSCKSVPKMAAFGLAPFSGTEYGGAVADLIKVPFADPMLVQLPAGLDPVAAAGLGDNAIDGLRTVRDALARAPGAKVLVAGGGAASIGLYAVAAARTLGASEVVYVDVSEERAALAERLGAKAVVQKYDDALKVGRFPITVDASSRAEGLKFCIASTDVSGTCTSVGIYFEDVALPLLHMYTRGMTFVTGRVDLRRDLPAGIELAQKGWDLKTVATRVVDWEHAPQAWLEPSPKLVIKR